MQSYTRYGYINLKALLLSYIVNSVYPKNTVYSDLLETESVKVQFEKFKCQVETNNVTLASKDVELTMAYDIIDSFKQDIMSLTDQLETLKSLRHQRR